LGASSPVEKNASDPFPFSESANKANRSLLFFFLRSSDRYKHCAGIRADVRRGVPFFFLSFLPAVKGRRAFLFPTTVVPGEAPGHVLPLLKDNRACPFFFPPACQKGSAPGLSRAEGEECKVFLSFAPLSQPAKGNQPSFNFVFRARSIRPVDFPTIAASDLSFSRRRGWPPARTNPPPPERRRSFLLPPSAVRRAGRFFFFPFPSTKRQIFSRSFSGLTPSARN